MYTDLISSFLDARLVDPSRSTLIYVGAYHVGAYYVGAYHVGAYYVVHTTLVHTILNVSTKLLYVTFVAIFHVVNWFFFQNLSEISLI